MLGDLTPEEALSATIAFAERVEVVQLVEMVSKAFNEIGGADTDKEILCGEVGEHLDAVRCKH